MKITLHHVFAYLVLVVGLGFFSYAFMLVSPIRSLQRIISLLICGFYLTWATIFLHRQKKLSKKTFAEYLFTSLMGLAMLLLLTL